MIFNFLHLLLLIFIRKHYIFYLIYSHFYKYELVTYKYLFYELQSSTIVVCLVIQVLILAIKSQMEIMFSSLKKHTFCMFFSLSGIKGASGSSYVLLLQPWKQPLPQESLVAFSKENI